MKSRSRHNTTKKGFMIFFTVTLLPFIKYHSPPCFPSYNITKSTETHPAPMHDIIIEQPHNGSSISQNLVSLNIFVDDLINLLYYEH